LLRATFWHTRQKFHIELWGKLHNHGVHGL
jgi:hypothetical protein